MCFIIPFTHYYFMTLLQYCYNFSVLCRHLSAYSWIKEKAENKVFEQRPLYSFVLPHKTPNYRHLAAVDKVEKY